MHRADEPEEAIRKSHHTQPNCRGYKSLSTRQARRGNGCKKREIQIQCNLLKKHGVAKCFGESTGATLWINGAKNRVDPTGDSSRRIRMKIQSDDVIHKILLKLQNT